MVDTPASHNPNSRFLAGTSVSARARRSRYGGALAGSMATHAAVGLLVLLLMGRLPPDTAASETTQRLVWMVAHGAPGGGSGDHAPSPARSLEAPGRDRLTIPAPRSLDVAREVRETPPTPIELPTVPSTAGVDQAVGVPSEVALPSSNSHGPGDGGQFGAGKGPLSGDGDGTRPGSDGCCEVFTSGIDIVPRLIHEVKPGYTNEAMRAKLQGVVVLEAVVMPDGSVGTVRILRSLDPNGLDKEAVRTVKLWRFSPGRKDGKPVASLVQVDMEFRLR